MPLRRLASTSLAFILGLLAELQDSQSLAYLHISHDLRLVSQFADEVAVMHEGRIVEQQSTRELFAAPAHPYTAELVASVSSIESILLQRSA